MSRPRSQSPRYRKFPWEEPGFDPYKVIAELNGDQQDRSHRSREDPEEHFGEDMYEEDQSRSSPFSDNQPFVCNKKEFYYKRLSSQRGTMGYDDRRPSPLHDGRVDEDQDRRGFREYSFENRGRSPQSPLRVMRERLPPMARSHSDHQQRPPGMGMRREEQDGRRERFSPGGRSDEQRGRAGWEKGKRNTQGFSRDGQREDWHQERTLPFKRKRREMEDLDRFGFRNEEDCVGPLVIEHDHGMSHSKEPLRWEQRDSRRNLDSAFSRQRNPHPAGSSQERFRTSDSRLDNREDARGRPFQDNWNETKHENRQRPMPPDRPNPVNYGTRGGPMNRRGRGNPRAPRGHVSHSRGGRAGLQPHAQQSLQGFQNVPHQEQRPGYRPFRKDNESPIEAEADWAGETRHQQWKPDRPGNLEQHQLKINLDPKMPRQRMQGWNTQKINSVAPATEETLTIKVDMSRPINQTSSLCYSSDRQLSLDLVNVGRQRLDFLPMLEHSGTYQETAMHTGTFAQEIITLVHHVKEQYFADRGLTLNERFSAPQKKGSNSEGAAEELTLDERFSSNRGFSLKMNSLLEDEEPLFSRLGPLPPVRGPGDLRHDLERRRQERLEGVKVTISGNSVSQRPPAPVREPDLEYNDKEEMALMEDDGFSSWPEEHSRRRADNMGQRRGALFRLNNGSQRRNNRFGNQLGPMRRQNIHNNRAGPNW